MSSGWLLSPVTGAGTFLDPIRAQVSGVQRPDGDRLEAVVGDQDRCLVAYEVADIASLTDLGGVLLADLPSLDGDEAALPAARRNQLRRLAQDVGIGDRGTIREVVRRIGKGLIGPQFHESVHLGSGRAPRPGSFVTDSFTDTDGTALEDHTGELGATWMEVEEVPAGGVISSAGRVRPNTTATNWYSASGSPAGAEYDIAADIHVASSMESAMGVDGRIALGFNTRYFFDHYSTANNWRFFKVVTGSFTDLGAFSQTLTVSNTYAIVLEVRDAAKKGYVGGVERISSADNAITAAGVAGLHPYGSGSNATGLHLDNFAASDPGGAPEPAEGRMRHRTMLRL